MLEKSMLFLSLMWVLPHILPEVEPLAVEFPAFPNAAREDDKSCHAFALIRILEKGSVDLLDVGGVTYRHTRASGAISQQFGWVSEYCQEAIATALEDWRYPTRKSGMQTVIRFSFELCLPD